MFEGRRRFLIIRAGGDSTTFVDIVYQSVDNFLDSVSLECYLVIGNRSQEPVSPKNTRDGSASDNIVGSRNDMEERYFYVFWPDKFTVP